MTPAEELRAAAGKALSTPQLHPFSYREALTVARVVNGGVS